jgi:hypothetical protein
VDAPALVVPAVAARLGRVKADPDRRREPVLASVAGQSPLDIDRALDGVSRDREGDEEAIAGRVDLLSAVARKCRAQLAVVPLQ